MHGMEKSDIKNKIDKFQCEIEFNAFRTHTHSQIVCICFLYILFIYVSSIFNVLHSNKIIISKNKSANLTTLLRTPTNYNVVLHT